MTVKTFKIEIITTTPKEKQKEHTLTITNGILNVMYIYKASCKIYNKFNHGNTQTNIKKGMFFHFQETKALPSKDKTSDNFSSYFTNSFYQNNNLPTSKKKDIRNICQFSYC